MAEAPRVGDGSPSDPASPQHLWAAPEPAPLTKYPPQDWKNTHADWEAPIKRGSAKIRSYASSSSANGSAQVCTAATSEPQLKAWDMSWREKAHATTQDTLMALGMDKYSALKVADRVFGGPSGDLPAADLVPLSNVPLSGNEAVRDFSHGRWIEGAIHVLGAIPIPGAGKLAGKAAEKVAESVVKKEAETIAANAVKGGTEQAAQQGIANSGTRVIKPLQVHHFATNKSKTWTPDMRKITDKYGLDLDGSWNKELMEHLGRHPDAYHAFVLRRMREADSLAAGDVTKFLDKFDELVKRPVLTNPKLLDKAGWPK